MQCRIAITTKCNLNCSYCCMKYDHIKKSFNNIKGLHEILDISRFESFGVTGGEPLMLFGKLVETLGHLRELGKPIYLYTNGLLLDFSKLFQLKGLIDGINIGLHKVDYQQLTQYVIFNSVIPMRIMVWEGNVDQKLLNFFKRHKLQYRAWVMDECDIPNEERYLLK